MPPPRGCVESPGLEPSLPSSQRGCPRKRHQRGNERPVWSVHTRMRRCRARHPEGVSLALSAEVDVSSASQNIGQSHTPDQERNHDNAGLKVEMAVDVPRDCEDAVRSNRLFQRVLRSLACAAQPNCHSEHVSYERDHRTWTIRGSRPSLVVLRRLETLGFQGPFDVLPESGEILDIGPLAHILDQPHLYDSPLTAWWSAIVSSSWIPYAPEQPGEDDNLPPLAFASPSPFDEAESSDGPSRPKTRPPPLDSVQEDFDKTVNLQLKPARLTSIGWSAFRAAASCGRTAKFRIARIVPHSSPTLCTQAVTCHQPILSSRQSPRRKQQQYAADFSDSEDDESPHLGVTQALLASLCDGPRPSAIVDLACGDGRNLITLCSALECTGLGIDQRAAYVSAAQHRAYEAGLGTRCEFRVGGLWEAHDLRAVDAVIAFFAHDALQVALKQVTAKSGLREGVPIFTVEPIALPSSKYFTVKEIDTNKLRRYERVGASSDATKPTKGQHEEEALADSGAENKAAAKRSSTKSRASKRGSKIRMVSRRVSALGSAKNDRSGGSRRGTL